MSYEKDLAAKTEADVLKRVGNHVITTRKIDGLYRHWHCGMPGFVADSFSVITWPGYLCYCGDMGDYLFSRTDDMVAFMRSACKSHGYAAEKCVASGNPIREWREEVFQEVLEDELNDARHDPDLWAEVSEKVETIREAVGDEDCEHDANQAIHDSCLWDGSDFPDCTAFHFRFLWCLYALKWFTEHVQDA